MQQTITAIESWCVGNTYKTHMKRLLSDCRSMSRTNCLKLPSFALDFVHSCKHPHFSTEIPARINLAPRRTTFKQEVVTRMLGLCNVFFNICVVDIDLIRMIKLLWETAFFQLWKLLAVFKSSYVTLRAQQEAVGTVLMSLNISDVFWSKPVIVYHIVLLHSPQWGFHQSSWLKNELYLRSITAFTFP